MVSLSVSLFLLKHKAPLIMLDVVNRSITESTQPLNSECADNAVACVSDTSLPSAQVQQNSAEVEMASLWNRFIISHGF